MEESVKKKIQKLLALATSDNEHEACAAMAKAAELAEQHGMAIGDIKREKDGSVSVEVVRSFIHAASASSGVWEGSLCVVISKCFDCEVLRTRNGPKKGDYAYVFMGTPNDVDMCLWMFKLLRLQIVRKGKMKFDLVKDQKMYGTGAVTSLHSRLNDVFLKEKERLRSQNTRDLVVIKNDEVHKKSAEWYPHTTKSKAKYKFNGSREAYAAGYSDGQTMIISKQVA